MLAQRALLRYMTDCNFNAIVSCQNPLLLRSSGIWLSDLYDLRINEIGLEERYCLFGKHYSCCRSLNVFTQKKDLVFFFWGGGFLSRNFPLRIPVSAQMCTLEYIAYFHGIVSISIATLVRTKITVSPETRWHSKAWQM